MSERSNGHILFLCTGNYYRSRFAEHYFNALASARGLTWRAQSRGLRLNPDNPGPISRQTVAWLEKRRVALPAEHRFPLMLSETDLQAAALVVALKEAEHRPLLEYHFPVWADGVEYWHIHDMDCALPQDALRELAVQVEALVQRLAAGCGLRHTES